MSLYYNKFDSTKSLGVCYWCVKMPHCGYIEHGLKHIIFCVQKHIAALVRCYNPWLVRDKPLGALASMKLVYYTVPDYGDHKPLRVSCSHLPLYNLLCYWCIQRCFCRVDDDLIFCWGHYLDTPLGLSTYWDAQTMDNNERYLMALTSWKIVRSLFPVELVGTFGFTCWRILSE